MSVYTQLCRVQGDVNDELTFVMGGVNDLTGAASIEAHVWRSGFLAATLAAAVSDPVERLVVVQLSPWLATATPGEWYFEIEMTFGDGTVLTWPSCDPPILRVRADGA